MAYLAVHHHRDIARERLSDLFWPESEGERSRDSLKTALCSIRRCLRCANLDPEEYLHATKSVVRWTCACGDVSKFEALVESDNIADVHEATRLYRGDFLEGDYGNWAIAERERLAALYESALARMIQSSNDPSLAREFIARNPYREEAYATMIEAALAEHQRSSALFWIRRCRQALAEIGEQPSASFDARFGSVELAASHRLALAPAG